LILATAVSVLLNALVLGAETKTFFLSSMKNEFVCQLVDNVIAMGIQLVNIEFLYALMTTEFCSGVLLVTDLAHHLHLGTVSLDVVVQLRSSHVLELLSVADIASKLRAVKLSVSL
jgi:hypothetical protein